MVCVLYWRKAGEEMGSFGSGDRTRKHKPVLSAGARGDRSSPGISTLVKQPAGRTDTLPLDKAGFHWNASDAQEPPDQTEPFPSPPQTQLSIGTRRIFPQEFPSREGQVTLLQSEGWQSPSEFLLFQPCGNAAFSLVTSQVCQESC